MTRLLACLMLLSAATGLFAADRAPNIVLIMADDLGYAELGCYGQQWIKTPNIDRLAAEGIRFTDFYSGNAVCAPSRCCLMTGKHPGHAYIRNNREMKDVSPETQALDLEYGGQRPLATEEVTIAEMLKQRGYATAAIGKWGLGQFGSTGDPNAQGFDLFYGFNCQRHAHNHYPKFLMRNREKEVQPGNDRTLTGDTYSQDQFTKVALEFIDENKDKPFFLYLPFAIPHLSIQAPDESTAEYAGTIPEEDYVHKGYLQHPTPRAGYAAMITHMDKDIGKILAKIEALGLDDNTLVMFTSDNGATYERLGGSDSDFFESVANLRGFKGSLYEGGVRVPLVARWPGKIKPGQVSHLPGALWDMMPTIAEVAKTKTPEKIDGYSLAPTMLGTGEQKVHDYLYWEFPAYGGQQSIRMGKWKGIRQNMMVKKNPDPLKIELYDLEADPGETTDLAAKHPDLVEKLAKLMAEAHTPSEQEAIPVLDGKK
ncbi:arylsulfatase [Blastopirellula sp. JC732]|uniref:Arylsulfatase n=1 Tax=Blastopirellula sediminis TaxID=2894196 RepID=A0A9X1MQ08_9BACT|nr:arylsulfatase [Blastopirellula sediminis]MCC9605362.1 arylsulfatase [Blastopirellula sediminis]MCC9631338.1 arylsulfatase [Blastopirellula sediminis]